MELEEKRKDMEKYKIQRNNVFKTLEREIRNLRTFYNPHPERANQDTASMATDLPTEPTTFQEAWWHKDLQERTKWRTAI